LFLREGALLLREFGPFPKENSLFPRELYFHQGTIFIPWGTCLGLTFNFFLLREITS